MTKIVIYIGLLVLIGFAFVSHSAAIGPVAAVMAGIIFGVAVAVVYLKLLGLDHTSDRN